MLIDINKNDDVNKYDYLKKQNYFLTLCENIISSVGDLCFLLDSSCRVIMVGKKTDRLLGVESDWLQGKNIWEIEQFGEARTGIFEMLKEAEKSDKPQVLKGLIVDKNSREKCILWNVSHFCDSSSDDKYFVLTGTDVTTLESLEPEYPQDSEANAQQPEGKSTDSEKTNIQDVKQVNELKTRLITQICHELHNPLNIIIGFLQLFQMEEVNISSRQKSNLQEIIEASEKLNEIIKNMTDYSLVIDNKLKPQLIEISSLDVERLCNFLNARLNSHYDTEIVFRTRVNESDRILSDRKQLERILQNILGKTVSALPAGSTVFVDLMRVEKDFLRIVISNESGPDSDNNEANNVSFSDLESINSDFDCCDVNLEITRKLVQIMGGRIAFKNSQAAGFEIVVDLPDSLSESYRGKNESINEPRTRGKYKVLYVEDNDANRRLVSSILLRQRHIELLVASTGLEGLEIAKNTPLDLIILDINLPDINGFTILNTIQQNPMLSCTRYFALTGNVTQDDIDRGLAAGFTKYITKPFEISKFVEAINAELDPRLVSLEEK